MTAACAPNETCIRYGTRGYIISHSGAQQLLLHAEPAVVQVNYGHAVAQPWLR